MSQLTQQQINQKRRQKILARTRKTQTRNQQQPVLVPLSTLPTKQQQQNQEEQAPFLNTQNSQSRETQKQQPNQSRQEQKDVFAIYRQIQAKSQREKILLVFSKYLGIIVTIVQFYLLIILKKYHTRYLGEQLSEDVFKQIEQRFLDELDLIFWACLGIITFIFIWIKYIKSTSQNTEKFQILPGSNMVTILQQINKIFQYKVLIKAVLGYIFSCIITQVILNQAVILLGYENQFYKPNLIQILTPISQNLSNQQIL